MFIKDLRFWCQKVLPLVYDDSLSYYEVLCKLTNKVNEIISTFSEYVEQHEQEYEELKPYIDSVIEEELRNYVAAIIANYENYPLTNLQLWSRGAYTEPFKICCVGDSITNGYDPNLNNGTTVAEQNQYPYVLNSALSNFYDYNDGEDDTPSFEISKIAQNSLTSSQLLEPERIAQIFGESENAVNPDLVILEIGVVDVASGVPFSVIAGNILQFANICKENNCDICIMNGIPLRNSDLTIPWSRFEYNKNMKKLSEASGLMLIDIYSAIESIYETTNANSSDLSADGSHLRNYSYIAYEVVKTLFGHVCISDKDSMQFFSVANTGKVIGSNYNVTGVYVAEPPTGTKTSFGRLYRLKDDSRIRCYTGSKGYYKTGVVLSCNKYGGKVRFWYSGVSHEFDTYLSGVNVENSVEKIFWFTPNRATYNSVTFRDISASYDGQTTPYCYLGAIVTVPLDSVPSASGIVDTAE